MRYDLELYFCLLAFKFVLPTVTHLFEWDLVQGDVIWLWNRIFWLLMI